MDILLCKSCVIIHLYMFTKLYYVIYFLGSDSAKKYCPTHIFPYLAPTPCLTNVGKPGADLGVVK